MAQDSCRRHLAGIETVPFLFYVCSSPVPGFLGTFLGPPWCVPLVSFRQNTGTLRVHCLLLIVPKLTPPLLVTRLVGSYTGVGCQKEGNIKLCNNNYCRRTFASTPSFTRFKGPQRFLENNVI